MTKTYSTITILIFVIIYSILSSCSSSKITSSWKSDESLPIKINKILVVAISKSDDAKDVRLKSKMEQHICDDLREKGIEGKSSAIEFGPGFFDGVTENSVLQKMETSGYDGILTIVLLDKERERHYVPGRMYYTPYIVYQRRFWGYYTTIYDRIYEPGYYEINTKYFWESNLFLLKSKNLIYSVQTKSFNPADTETLAHEYGMLISRDLFKQKVLLEYQ